MLIKDIINAAAKLLNLSCAEAEREGDNVVCPSESAGEPEVSEREKELLLKCVDFIIDEVARDYFPLLKEEKMTAVNGKLFFADFSREPTAVASVFKDGRRLNFARLYDGLKLPESGEVTVKYTFKPFKATLDGETEWADSCVSERILAYGTAAEYCIAAGFDSDAEMWDKRYRDALERAVIKYLSGKTLPKRRWLI